MSVRTRLKNISTDIFKAVNKFDEQTNGWLTPFIGIPLILSFKAATALETNFEKDNRLANIKENELLYAVKKMIYNPTFLLGTEQTRQNHLRDFKGEHGTYSVQEMQDYIESDFSKVWGSALVFGNRQQNLDFIAQHAIRKVGDPNDKNALRETLKTLMDNPDTFGHEVQSVNQISVDDAFEHAESINNERDNKLEELAALAVFNHGLGVSMTGYEQVRKSMIGKSQNDWLQRYDITPDDVLNYAIDNANNIIDTKYGDMTPKTKNNLKSGMATLKEQRDGTEVSMYMHNELY